MHWPAPNSVDTDKRLDVARMLTKACMVVFPEKYDEIHRVISEYRVTYQQRKKGGSIGFPNANCHGVRHRRAEAL